MWLLGNISFKNRILEKLKFFSIAIEGTVEYFKGNNLSCSAEDYSTEVQNRKIGHRAIAIPQMNEKFKGILANGDLVEEIDL